MSKNTFKLPRDPEVIAKEYAEMCAMAGDKNYRIEILKSELQQINTKLFDLNKEHGAAQKEKTDKKEDKKDKKPEGIDSPAALSVMEDKSK